MYILFFKFKGYKKMKKYSNIDKRIYKSGNISYRVRIGYRINGQKKKLFSLTFQDQEEAKAWLNENYYKFFEDPDKYIKMKKKYWS